MYNNEFNAIPGGNKKKTFHRKRYSSVDYNKSDGFSNTSGISMRDDNSRFFSKRDSRMTLENFLNTD
jgi:hypothetical protein